MSGTPSQGAMSQTVLSAAQWQAMSGTIDKYARTMLRNVAVKVKFRHSLHDQLLAYAALALQPAGGPARRERTREMKRPQPKRWGRKWGE